jgi:threonyl-tRNA synthetase
MSREGVHKTPYCIHRAPLGTHERFVAFLIEHYGGAFPMWLAPVQVRILPTDDRFHEHADRIVAALRAKFIRAEADTGKDKLGKKIREGTIRKIPVLAILGERESESNSLQIRRYGIEEQRAFDVDALVASVEAEIKSRKHVTAWE